jgi:hypothetical protein
MEEDTAPRPRRRRLLTALLVVGAIAGIPVSVALAANTGSGGSSSGASGGPAHSVADPGRDRRDCPKHHGQDRQGQQDQQNQQDLQGTQGPTTEL